MISMTGYGKAEYKENGLELTIEIKTVNNRYLDINFKYPRGFTMFEEVLRNTVKEKLRRGRADIFVNFTDNREKVGNLSVDLSLAKSYFKAACDIKNAINDSSVNNIGIAEIIKYPEVIKIDDTDDNEELLTEPMKVTMLSALEALNSMREREGAKLEKDIMQRLEKISLTLEKIKQRAPSVAASYKEKLKQRMEEYLGNVQIDETRMLNEVAVFSDRCNIDEEITRLNSHISQFKKISKENSSGKKLDFLIQEFNRETNTICSKSNDIEVTNLGLELKCEIEKIREQIQNIE